MAAAKKTSVPADRLDLYLRLLGTVEGIEPKVNFGSAYTAVNGNMFSMISKHGVVGIRLPKELHAEFLAKYSAEVFRGDPAWPPSKEYVAVPDDLLARTAELTRYLDASYRHALTLKPKTTRKKATE
jgi:TfoX/Sxy family transcriptional regulator of competence genes